MTTKMTIEVPQIEVFEFQKTECCITVLQNIVENSTKTILYYGPILIEYYKKTV